MNLNATADKCIPQESSIENVRLAQAYVPFQIRCTMFNMEESLIKGTIFPPLADNYQKRKEIQVYDDE